MAAQVEYRLKYMSGKLRAETIGQETKKNMLATLLWSDKRASFDIEKSCQMAALFRFITWIDSSSDFLKKGEIKLLLLSRRYFQLLLDALTQ
jgi:hypothetical protein